MTLLELYRSLKLDGTKKEVALQLLIQTHWFTINTEFDPRTGEALPQALSTFLSKVADTEQDSKVQDRLYRIIEHARPALELLLRAVNESPKRRHEIMPVRSVWELDAGCFMKLSMRPGRTVREKLADKPYLQAVRRFLSIDLPENRLLKAFVLRLAELLEWRQEFLGEPEDEMLPKIRSWLYSDEIKAVGRWENLPPNNMLLSHRDYRRVWDSWRRLQTLDEDIANDLAQLEERYHTMEKWKKYGQIYSDRKHLFAEMPVLFDYDAFKIHPWQDTPLVKKVQQPFKRPVSVKPRHQVVCVDMIEIHPHYAIDKASVQSLDDTFIWQQWKNKKEAVDLELFKSDALYLHPDTDTVTSQDLFFADVEDIPDQLLERAASEFATQLRSTFINDKLIWLVPDAVNDFDLEIIRRNLNARFPNAEPLPRSVAALFANLDYKKITGEGFAEVVVDTIGGIICATKLTARFDQELKDRLSETKGYYWERSPSVILSKELYKEIRHFDMMIVDENEQWSKSTLLKKSALPSKAKLKSDPHIGNIANLIPINESPVVGGIRLHELQQKAGDIPLWRDQIPELSIMVMKEERYERFYLVSRGHTIKPIRGHSVPIPIKETFQLPAGKEFYQFPLYKGESDEDLRYSARLDSLAFPRATNTDCKLNLTFRYGDNEPYTLIFTPMDKSFPSVRATWRRTILTDAPGPGFPKPNTWNDMYTMPKKDGCGTSDLLDWFCSAIDRLDSVLNRKTGEILYEWRENNKGQYYTHVECDGIEENVYLNEKKFVKGVHYSQFSDYDIVSFELIKDTRGKFSGKDIAGEDYTPPNSYIIGRITKSLNFPFIAIWKEGRSLSDPRCPASFAQIAKEKIAYLGDFVRRKDMDNGIKKALFFLLACLHKDTIPECMEQFRLFLTY